MIIYMEQTLQYMAKVHGVEALNALVATGKVEMSDKMNYLIIK